MSCNTFRPLAVVVVNYASHELLEKNLVAVAAATPDAQVVVVDSHSSSAEESAVSALATRHGWSVVRTESNVGFGVGMNLGVAAAKAQGAEAFLLLNPDAAILGPSVALLRETLEQAPLTLLAPTIFDAGGNVWFAGADLHLDSGETRASSRRRAGERVHPWLTGACLMVGAELWEKVNGFDERYFLYWEDVDLSFRVCRAGGSLVVVDGATAVHDEGGTQHSASEGPRLTGRAKSNLYYRYNIRNRLLFAALNLAPADRRRWKRGAVPAAYQVLLRGGRKQFLHSAGPLWAGIHGTAEGLALMRRVGRGR
ncbi:glycosyltransferase family 2 protein [Arthrobacter sp. LAPM80]|uniref:glycosyltransferase n=1 Tax=Arthrobacter sp. LAPM80 TaxID=3141788 RepID=UPI00398ADD26